MFRPVLALAMTLACAAAPAFAQTTPAPKAAPAPVPAAAPIAIKPVGTLDGWLQCRAASTAVGEFLTARRAQAQPAQQQQMDQQLQALATINEGSRQGAAHTNKTAKLAEAELTRRQSVYMNEFKRPDGLRTAAQVLDGCQTELLKHMEPATPQG